MREIKCRAWLKEERILLPVASLHFPLPSPSGKDLSVLIDDAYEWRTLEEVIIEHYTGLHDKSDKEIFEGDIINWSVRLRDKATGEIIRLRKKGVVEWRKAKASFTLRSFCIPNGMEAMYMGDYEIIGNIHDNPELLEVAE